MKKATVLVTGALLVFGASAYAQSDNANENAFVVRGDNAELVHVLPAHANQSTDAAQYATVYKASYGSGNLQDHGGLEIANAGFVQVYYGSSSPTASERSVINGFVNAFGSNVPDYNVVVQYGSHATIQPTLTNAGTFNDSMPAISTISDAGIQSYLAAKFTAGSLTASANNIYGVYLPAGTSSTMGSSASCTGYCGYHSHFTYGGKQIKYAVFPYLTCSGCSLTGKTVADMLTIITSHEIREAVTDPGDNGTNAWYDRRGYEADDKCAWHNLYKMAVGGYWVQPEYSNAAGGCVVP